MPNIRQYDAGNLALRPTETGIEARAASARRIGASFNQVGGATQQLGQETAQLGAFKAHVTSQFGGALAQGISDAGSAAVRYMDHQQISHGALGLAGLFANATQEWQDIAKSGDPNDPTLAKRFLEEKLEPALEKFRSSFTTERSQAWAESHIDNLRQHFFTSTAATMSTLAGQAVALNHRQTVNQLAATVRQDPSGLDAAIGLVEGATNGVVDSSPNLSADAAGRARTELTQTGKEALVKSAVMGMIEKNPDLDLAKVEKKYGAYITPTELAQFQKYAQSRAKSNLLTEKQTQLYNKQQDQIVANAKLSKNFTDNVSFDENGKATIKPEFFQGVMDVEKDHPGAATGNARSMINWGRAVQERADKPEPLSAVSHATTMKLLGRMRATDESRLTDNQPIYDAYQRGDLTNADFNFLNREFTNLRSPEGIALEKDRGNFTKSFARLIDGAMNSTGVHSVLGTQRMYEVEMDARRQEEVLRKEGKDPHLVYDPRSEYFFGRPENIAKYRISLQEAQSYEKTLTSMDKANQAPKDQSALPKVGDRKQFKQGWGVWNGTTYVPEKP